MKVNLLRPLFVVLLVLVSVPIYADEFQSIFDGKSLKGWHLMNGATFVAEEGVLKLNGGQGWLRSDKQYSDFILRLELRFMKPKQDGESSCELAQRGRTGPTGNTKCRLKIPCGWRRFSGPNMN